MLILYFKYLLYPTFTPFLSVKKEESKTKLLRVFRLNTTLHTFIYLYSHTRQFKVLFRHIKIHFKKDTTG